MNKTFKSSSICNISNFHNGLFEIYQRFKGRFLNELGVSFNKQNTLILSKFNPLCDNNTAHVKKKSFGLFILYLYNKFFLVLEKLYKRSHTWLLLQRALPIHTLHASISLHVSIPLHGECKYI